LLRLTLRGGSVYYLQHRSLSSPEPHYFIVLNAAPHRDEFLVLAVATSNVDGVHRRCKTLPPETVVLIAPSDYFEFAVPSAVDCNHWFRITKAELLQKLQAGLAAERASLPSDLLARLRRGVLASPLVEAETKDLLR
jgi:hypothetical protein